MGCGRVRHMSAGRQLRLPPVKTRITLVAAFALGCLVLSVSVAAAATDLINITRAHFPDRLWTPISAVDAAQAGAGRVIDQSASWSANPATMTQLLAGKRSVLRLNGMAIDVRRKDIVANSENYSDQSPFLYYGETGLAFPFGEWVIGASLSPYAYDKQKSAFIDTTEGQAPIPLTTEIQSSVDRLSMAGARALGSFSLSASLDGYLSREKYKSTPSEEAQGFGALPAAVDLKGKTLGGSLGATYRATPWLVAGAVARVAGELDLKDKDDNVVGKDEIPMSFEFGAQVGKGSGGNFFIDAAYRDTREVALGDSVGRGTNVSPARWNLAASYAYRPATAMWEFLIGAGWSPQPSDGGASTARFGIGLGYDFEGLAVRGSFSEESRREADGDESSRRFLYLGVDLSL
jgi:hypothetical protein